MNDAHPDPSKIEEHIRSTYLQQLPLRLAKLKQLYIERNWGKLKMECEKLATGAQNHGLPALSSTALAAALTIPPDVDPNLFSLSDESRTALFTLLESNALIHDGTGSRP